MDKVKDGYLTFKEYADKTGVTYESVRQLVHRNQKHLKGHVHKIGRRKYLDTKAQEFLKERQNKNTTKQTQETQDNYIDEYKVKIERLEQQVADLTAENKSLSSELLVEQKQHIEDLQKHQDYAHYITVLVSGTRKEKRNLRKRLTQNNDLEEN